MSKIPPPSSASLSPDKDTKKGLPDYTGSSADSRVLHINLGFFKYGTNDKAHAAAIVLSLLLLLIIVVVIVCGMYSANTVWAEKVFSWVGSAFLFISGVALGGQGANRKKKHKSLDNND